MRSRVDGSHGDSRGREVKRAIACGGVRMIRRLLAARPGVFVGTGQADSSHGTEFFSGSRLVSPAPVA